MKVRVIGAGLAGSEAAIYLSKLGYDVDLYEMRPKFQTGAHKTSLPAELVCSNSLGSSDVLSASGLLIEEGIRLGSTLFNIAKQCSVPSGNSLSIDRMGFSEEIQKIINNSNNIKIINEKYDEIDTNIPTIIATGPLTESKLAQNIKDLFNENDFKFFDAIAPIVEKDSINFEKAFYASRWNKGSDDFINCPMNKDEYENFYNILINAQQIKLHDFEEKEMKANYFEGCMPIEVMAKRGIDTLRFGPLKPVGLFDKRIPTEFKKNQFYAVVQLRQDDKMANLYNLVGFQTNLKWSEQKKLIQSIPGLENASITRYGVMHVNTFINSPAILNKHLQSNKFSNIFFAGQLTGVEGYSESIITGLFSAINMDRYLKNKPMITLTNNTMLGALIEYITYPEHKNFQPTNANWGIVGEIIDDKKKLKDKKYKNTLRSNRALSETDKIKAIIKEQL